MKRFWTISLFIFIAGVSAFADNHTNSGASSSIPDSKLNLDAVNQLLTLMDTIVAENPDFVSVIEKLRTMNAADRDREVQKLIGKNMECRAMRDQIDLLLDSPAYRMYYAQFKNVDTSIHRRILYDLPYRTINSPADISFHLYELLRHRNDIRSWVNKIISQIDIKRSHDIAAQWIPPGEYSIPSIYFIYDGNGGAFAARNSVCFDIYGTILALRPDSTRYLNLDSIGTDDIEQVLAHEFHHIYSKPYYPRYSSDSTAWQKQWIMAITRLIVSEGAAMRCNPPKGFGREIREDPEVVRYWINELNEKFRALNAAAIDGDRLQKWYNDSYEDTARRLLIDFLKRKYPDADTSRLTPDQLINQPSLIYTLGWWIISKISDGGKNRDKVIALFSDPQSVFTVYNRMLGEKDKEFRFDF